MVYFPHFKTMMVQVQVPEMYCAQKKLSIIQQIEKHAQNKRLPALLIEPLTLLRGDEPQVHITLAWVQK